MLVCTTWKMRPLSPEQTARMMTAWGKMEAKIGENPNSERIGWYLRADGTGGLTIVDVKDDAAQHQLALQQALTLGEFLELDSTVVLDLETALPAIMAAVDEICA